MHSTTLRSLQLRLEEFYALEQAPDIVEFVHISRDEPREVVLVRQSSDEDLEIAVVLPATVERTTEGTCAPDLWLQLVEAASHFVYLAERARIGLPATQLELELQAEVDKFVMSAFVPQPFAHHRALAVHGDLYEKVRFLHPENSEAGARYRLANALAARFMARLMLERDAEKRHGALRRFYRSGQAEKIRLARAA